MECVTRLVLVYNAREEEGNEMRTHVRVRGRTVDRVQRSRLLVLSHSQIASYFSIFSAVPVQLVPSISHAFHDGIARVAARISAITLSLRSSCRVPLTYDIGFSAPLGPLVVGSPRAQPRSTTSMEPTLMKLILGIVPGPANFLEIR